MITKEHSSVTVLPDRPGVYFFKKGKEILYVGKATSLRDRVRSYFLRDLGVTRGPLLVKMMAEADRVEYKETPSVLEALILEAHEIKTKQPPFNSRDKDDKSYNYVVITRESFPRVLVVRGRDLEKNSHEYQLRSLFGPFPHGGQLREALKIVRKIFPFRDRCTPFPDAKKPKPCFNRQLGLCPGVCTGEVSAQEYRKTIKNLELFFSGETKKVKKNLTEEMSAFAKSRKFEKAEVRRLQLHALDHIRDVGLIKREQAETAGRNVKYRIEAYDIAHTAGSGTVGVMVVMNDGELAKGEYRKFKVRGDGGKVGINDVKNLQEILVRRLGHANWDLPQLIVIDGGKAQLRVAEKVLKERGFSIEVVSVVKDDFHKPKDILGRKGTVEKHGLSILVINQEAHRFALAYHRVTSRRAFLPRSS